MTFGNWFKIFFEAQQAKYPDLIYLTPHKLRHTYASYMLQSGADVETVKMLLGHSNIATTSLYIHSGYKQMVNAAEQLRFT